MKLPVKFETEYQNDRARKVINILVYKIKSRNIFGWRYFLDDVVTLVLTYMAQTNFEIGIGAYVNYGMQGAIDHSRYCNAKKRRGNFEAIPIDDCLGIEDDGQTNQIKCLEICIAVEQKFGKYVAEILKPVIYGEQVKLDAHISKIIKTEEMKEFLQNW